MNNPPQNIMANSPMRKVTNQELADLGEDWENSTVDTYKYYQNVLSAWEVTGEQYSFWKSEGRLCQVYNKKYYVA